MYESLTDEEAIDYAQKSIVNLKGITRASWERVLKMARQHLRNESLSHKKALDFSSVMENDF